jgi:hypothetical protein
VLNASWRLKLLWMALGGGLILAWVGVIFSGASTERTMLATAAMLFGVILFSINAAALGEELLGPGGEGEH